MTPQPFRFEAPVVPIHMLDEERERMRAWIRAQHAKQLRSARRPVPHVRWPFILALAMTVAAASLAAALMVLS